MSERNDAVGMLAALELLDVGISILDSDFVVIYANANAGRMLDIPARLTAPGCSLVDIFRFNAERGEYGPGDVESLVAERVALINQRVEHRFERVRPNGQIIEIHGKPTPDGGFVTLYVDVSERKNAEQALMETRDGLEARVQERTAELKEREADLALQKTLLETTLENISQGISVFDGDLTLRLSNDRFYELMDLPKELGRPGTPLADFFTYNAERGEYGEGDVGELVESRLEKARNPQPHNFTRVLSDGTVVEVSGNPMPETMGGFVTTYSDVTARVHAQEEAVEAMEEAEGALMELQDMQASLVQAEKMAALGQLVAGVAHEINTPVGVSLTMNTHLQEKLAELEQSFEQGNLKKSVMTDFIQTARESLELSVKNMQRAAKLVDSFKKIAVDQESEDIKSFNILEYCQAVILSLQSKSREKHVDIHLSCADDIKITSYAGAFSRAVTNILLNSIEHAFGENGGRITMAISLDDALLRVVISDNGCGIPAELLPRIFDPFVTTDRGSGRSGLGLNRVYNIVTTGLKGTIECSSKEGAGTITRIAIPADLTKDS